MRPSFFIVASLLLLHLPARADTVEMTTGPDVVVSYVPTAWKPLAPLRPPQPGTYQSMTWELQLAEPAQISVSSRPEPKNESEFRREVLLAQQERGDSAKLVRERRQSLANRDWLVLEFRNENTRPTATEIHYFLPTDDGHITLFVTAAEASLPRHREAIESFLNRIQLK